MRYTAVLAALSLAACADAEASRPVPDSQAVTPAAVLQAGCETNEDAGTHCDVCPGNVGTKQTDSEGAGGYAEPLPDGGMRTVVTFRECSCPTKAGATRRGVLWRSCPPLPPGFAGYPATTCAQVASEFAAVCAGN